MSDLKYCLVVPHFNHLTAFTLFLPSLLKLDIPCIVVDDGSSDEVKQALRDLLQGHTQCILIEHFQNKGKGAAMLTGLKLATEHRYTHALQIDADGQHDLADVPVFLEYSRAHPQQIVSGAPLFDKDAPKARVYGRKVTDFFVAIETLSLGFKDSLCGFRIYPLAQFEQLRAKHKLGPRMEFDTEVLVKFVWLGNQVHFISTKVVYLPNSVSHFDYLQDNISLVWLHIRLLFGVLWRFPKLLMWRLNGHFASVN